MKVPEGNKGRSPSQTTDFQEIIGKLETIQKFLIKVKKENHYLSQLDS